MKSATPLNLPSTKERFEAVSFVKNMSALQLKVFIERMWNNLSMLANQMEGRRKDVSTVIDNIREGKRWTPKDLDDRYVYASYSGYVLRFDTLTKNFDVLDSNYEVLEGPFKGVTRSDIKRIKKERAKVS